MFIPERRLRQYPCSKSRLFVISFGTPFLDPKLTCTADPKVLTLLKLSFDSHARLIHQDMRDLRRFPKKDVRSIEITRTLRRLPVEEIDREVHPLLQVLGPLSTRARTRTRDLHVQNANEHCRLAISVFKTRQYPCSKSSVFVTSFGRKWIRVSVTSFQPYATHLA
jgi:hypothetical protein